ncbi:MAG: WYL domain-containing protein [Aeriscardovia sp.]|nr:WYL domain-containing protein [Aeriscardovia sp.]MBR2755088.1 WYL domain-containing protein [Lachnospiraceae bacterium]
MDNDAKLRPLYLGKILYERTDEETFLTTNELIRMLKEEYGISSHRQTIATEIELLKDFGMDIKCVRGRQNRYYLVSREFDLAELKLIIDAVDACKFISRRESKKLSAKLIKLAGNGHAEDLKRNGSVEGRVRTTNEKTCLIIDAVNTAINTKKRIAFRYYTYDAKKKKILKHDGMPYVLSPYELIWDGDRYYILGWSDWHDALRTFRVDRISDVPMILDVKSVKKPSDFNSARFVGTNYRMFAGETKDVTLLCDNDTMDSMVDRFGEKVKTELVDEDHFRLKAEVADSHVFYAWIFGFGKKVKIEGPEDMKAAYRKMLKDAQV